MDKPTEHQPLDDFFRRKLSDASVSPSTEGWARLQNRLAEPKANIADKSSRRIGGGWYWSASVAAACLLMAFLWTNWKQTEQGMDKTSLAVTRRPGDTIAMTQKVNPAPDNASISQSATSTNLSILTEKVQPTANVEDQLDKEGYGRIRNSKSVDLKTERKTEIEVLELIAKSPEKQPEKAQPKSELLKDNTPIAATDREVNPEPTQSGKERTLIVNVVELTLIATTDATATQPENREVDKENPILSARVANVFRQIKRLKEGEALVKADINDNGFNDDEGGLFNRIVRTARSRDNQFKQQK